jgi:hypothetical protein
VKGKAAGDERKASSARKQIESLRELEELDMNVLDLSDPRYGKLGFKLPPFDLINSAEDRRKEILAKLEPCLVAEYERIRKRYGGKVVVQVINEFCGGCYIKLPSELMTREKTQVLTCPNCGRFLYRVR